MMISQAELKEILTSWIIELYKNDPAPVEASSIRNVIPTKLNYRTNRLTIANQNAWNDAMLEIGTWSLVIFAYVLIVLVILKLKGKKVYTSIITVCIVLIIASIILTQFSMFNKVLWPGDRTYFDNYEYVSGLSLPVRDQLSSETIIACGKHAFNHEIRIVGFIDGHVSKVREDAFQRIIREQGIFEEFPDNSE